ncbi:hypothetical protein QFZ75_001606 [Streptomyces sp. V3I8]|uniref:hypothetical protein n=1 Tax=Streptomyces sp. V3I8 TaxID=3042279 RepID=UPI00278542DF|nr:hypothetical protein [Streptomyces sp. V3I8]MDQ1035190.1 hypothetical protein [Streptomyces sp. V3I8]
MAVEQLPGQVREFAQYFGGLLSRLDQGGGWCGVFWQRDPDGMRACLDGAEVPPWDVVQAVLQDLAAAHGDRAAAQESERARALHGASLAAYDARPGGRDALGDRLDVMLREQRYAAERLAELGRALPAAATRAETDALGLDLAWARDDHDRATARCAELRTRMDELDRRTVGGHAQETLAIPSAVDGGGAVWIDGPEEDRAPEKGRAADEAAGSGGDGAVAAAASRRGVQRSASGADDWPDLRGGGMADRAAHRDSAPASEPLPAPDTAPVSGSGPAFGSGSGPVSGSRPAFGTGSAFGTGQVSGSGSAFGTGPASGTGPLSGAGSGVGPGPGHSTGSGPGPGTGPGPGPGTGPVGAGPASDMDSVFDRGRAFDAGMAPYGGPAPYAAAPHAPAPPEFAAPHPEEESAGAAVPAAPKQRSRRRLRGGARGSARFAGAADAVADPEEGAGDPAGPAPVAQPAARTPRGARFAGGAEEGGQAKPRREALDDEARRTTVETVAELVRLRGEGRTGEAHAVLVEAAYWPAARLPLLAAELHRAGLGADWATLLWEAVSLPADRLVAAADALVAAGRTADGEQMLRQGVARPAPEIGEAVLGLVRAGRHREVRALVDAYVRIRAPEEAVRSIDADPQLLAPLLLAAARDVSEQRHWDLVHALRVAGHTA